jgi:hypothetical protein
MSATDNLDEVLKALGELLRKKNAAYGDSFANVPKILAIMFPQIPEPTLRLVLLFARYLDKIARRAATPNAFGEDEVLDFAGYGVLDLCLVWAAKKEQPKNFTTVVAPTYFPTGTRLVDILYFLKVEDPLSCLDCSEVILNGEVARDYSHRPSAGTHSLVLLADPKNGQERREWTIVVEMG